MARQRQQDPAVVKNAIKGDQASIEMLVHTFLPSDESIVAAEFLGSFGVFYRYRSFFAVTNRRAIAIEFKPGGGFVYTDGQLEHINSSGIGQPSKTSLYLQIGALGIYTLGLGLILAPMVWRRWHLKNKSGIFLNVREGISVQAFVDNETLPTAVEMYRQFSLARDDRMQSLSLAV